jgi:DNA-binding IclR family transcriptional regulator
MPLHATAVGLCLLAFAEPELRERVLSAPLRRFTSRTLCDPTEVRRMLADVRRTGVAISDRQIEMVSQSIGAPVRGPSGDVVAALSIVVPAEGNPHAYVPAVRAAARGIGRALARSG